MLSFAFLLVVGQAGHAVEPLPIDEVMAQFEAAIPELRQFQSETEQEIGRLGPTVSDWSESGLSMSSAIQAEGKSSLDYGLGEWQIGGHAVLTRGDRPLPAPADYYRYLVRDYVGPIDYHYYHRVVGVSTQVVIHSFGAVQKIGNSECSNGGRIEVISSEKWRNWPAETLLVVFGMLHVMRDDTREYCNLYKPNGKGGYLQVSYTSVGQPYTYSEKAPQIFVVTPLGEASERIFQKDTKMRPKD